MFCIWPQGSYSQHFIFLGTYKWAQYVRVVPYIGWIGLPRTNTLVYWAYSNVTQKIKCNAYDPRDCIHNNSFSFELTKGHNMLQCCFTLGQKSLPRTKTLVYWAHSYVTQKMKGCAYCPRDHIHNTLFSFELAICQSVALQQSGNACRRQTLYHIVPICKLQRK